MFQPWLGRVNLDRAGHQILTAEKLPALHAAVMRACADARGVIDDPRACTFQPSSLRCPAGTDTAACLTPAQVDVVRAFYRGPTDSHGRNPSTAGCRTAPSSPGRCGPPADGDPPVTVDMMTPLVHWVRDGVAPGAVNSESVTPFDPTRAAPRNNGLNSNYHYAGYASTYRPGTALWCHQDGMDLHCTGH